MRAMTSCSAHIFVYNGNNNQKDANKPSSNTNMCLCGEITAQEIASMSHCHFGNLTEIRYRKDL